VCRRRGGQLEITVAGPFWPASRPSAHLQVDDLMNKFRDYYQGKPKTTMPELRRSYDLLIMKVLSLLQDSDKKLASEVVSSREAIWALLSDPKKFATLQT
jgi:hypothetical protein